MAVYKMASRFDWKYIWTTWGVATLICNVLGTLANTSEQKFQTISLESRVLLLYNQPITIKEVKAINVQLIKDKPFLVQIWRYELDWSYTLVWQQEVPIEQTLSYDERINHTLNVPIPFGPILPHDRLGVYTIEDPIPVPIVITNEEKRRVIVSPSPDLVPILMTPNITKVTFNSLAFPYTVPVDCLRLCSELDCGLNIIRPTTSEPTKQKRVASTVVASLAEGHFLLSIPFLTGLFVWMIILTFILLSIICLIVCLFFKKKDKNEEHNSASDQRDPGEWYVVMDDPPYSLNFDTSRSTPVTSSARQGHMTTSDDHLAFENIYQEENI